MKFQPILFKLKPANIVALLLLLAGTLFSLTSTAGSRKLVTKGTNGAPFGYYEYLPSGYKNSGAGFPVILYLHGAGEVGNGTSEISKMKQRGLPKLLEQGKELPFVVLAPQGNQWWQHNNPAAFLDWLKTKYNIDPDRIYLTGISIGGTETWKLGISRTDEIAAILPLGGRPDRFNYCELTDTPVWAIHGEKDNIYAASYSRNAVNETNACTPAPNPRAKYTEYKNVGHDDLWDYVYSGSKGDDVYSWFLQYRLETGNNQPTNKAPVANAGPDQTLTLPTNSITLNGSGSDADGSITAYQWNKTAGPQASLSNANSANLLLQNLVEGNYTFSLTVTDNRGAKHTDYANLRVNRASTPPQASEDVFLVNFNYGGNQGGNWNNFDQNPDAGDQLTNLRNEQGQRKGINLKLLTAWGFKPNGNSGYNNYGQTTGNNSGAFPDAVMKTAFWSELDTPEQIEISNLSPQAYYTLELFGGRKNSSNRYTRYEANGKSGILLNSNNTKNTVTLANLRANSSGKIILKVSKANGSKFCYLNAMRLVQSAAPNSDDDDDEDDEDDATSSAIARTFQINFNYGSNQGGNWNNFDQNPDTGDRLDNLQDEQGNRSSVSLALLSPWGFAGSGDSGYNNYGMSNSNGAYPQNVMETSYFTERNEGETIKVSGLDRAKSYSFTFFGSRNGGGNRTSVYTIGNKSGSLNASYNVNETVSLTNVKPNSQGEILIRVSKGSGASYAYLNAMTIEENGSDTNARIAGNEAPANAEAAPEATTTVAPASRLSYANRQLQIAREGAFTVRSAQAVDLSGAVYNLTVTEQAENLKFASVQNLPSGIYILVLQADSGEAERIRFVKAD